MAAATSISTINTAIDTPTAIPTTRSSSSSSGAVDCIERYSLSTNSGPSSYENIEYLRLNYINNL